MTAVNNKISTIVNGKRVITKKPKLSHLRVILKS